MIPIELSLIENHLWLSTLCAAGVWILTLVLRRNRAAVRHGLWFAASIKFLVPFAVLAGIGSHSGWELVPANARPQVANVLSDVEWPFAVVAASVRPSTAQWAHGGSLQTVLLSLWLCGFVVGLVMWMRSWMRMREIVRGAQPMNLDLPIPALSFSACLEPGVFGIRKPVLLLPEGITERLTSGQLQAVLAHELCHVRRRDNLTGAIHMIVEVIFWFHPLVWWIRRQLIAERERACDEEVARQASEPQVYADAILSVCKLYLELPASCVSGVTGASLKDRIEEIMAQRTLLDLSRWKRILLAGALAAGLTGPIAVGVLRAQPPAREAFDVASVKLNTESRKGGYPGLAPGGQRYTATVLPLQALIVLAYGVFLGGKLGLGNVHGYAPLAWTAGGIIGVGGLIAAVGVRRYAGALPVAARDETALHRRLFSELIEIFRNPSFRIMFSCSVLFYAAQGMAAALTQHMFRFVWKIDSSQILVISLNIFAGLLVGVPLAPLLSRPLKWRGLLLLSPVLGMPIALMLSIRLSLPVALAIGLGISAVVALALAPRWRPMEKRTTLILGLAMFCLAQGGLSGLRALGIFTATGAAVVGPICLNTFMAGVGLAFVTIAIGSMMADASDEHDLLFGARREGMYFAGLGFAAKAATGLGALLAGVAIDVIRFPAAAAAAGADVHLSPQMLTNLTLASGPTAAAISFVGTCFFFLYRIDRKRHTEIAEALALRKATAI